MANNSQSGDRHSTTTRFASSCSPRRTRPQSQFFYNEQNKSRNHWNPFQKQLKHLFLKVWQQAEPVQQKEFNYCRHGLQGHSMLSRRQTCREQRSKSFKLRTGGSKRKSVQPVEKGPINDLAKIIATGSNIFATTSYVTSQNLWKITKKHGIKHIRFYNRTMEKVLQEGKIDILGEEEQALQEYCQTHLAFKKTIAALRLKLA